MRQEYKRALQSVILLLMFSTLVGVVSNAVREPSLPLFQPLPQLFPGEISLGDAWEVWGSGGVEFWDVRSGDAYQRAHIPRALSVDESPGGRGKVVVYCSSRLCPKADRAARRLRAGGYQDVWVMPDGIKGWNEAGYPLEPGKT